MSDAVSKSRPDGHKATVLDVRKEYERLAMHFNDLIMQLRTRSLGGGGIGRWMFYLIVMVALLCDLALAASM